MVDKEHSTRNIRKSNLNTHFSLIANSSSRERIVHFTLSLSANQSATVTIFAMTGDVVTVLSNIRKNRFSWDGKHSPPGVYIAKAECGFRQLIRHFTLIH